MDRFEASIRRPAPFERLFSSGRDASGALTFSEGSGGSSDVSQFPKESVFSKIVALDHAGGVVLGGFANGGYSMRSDA